MKYWISKQEWHFDLYKKGLILLSFPFSVILLTKEELLLYLHNTESGLNGFKTISAVCKKKINSFFFFTSLSYWQYNEMHDTKVAFKKNKKQTKKKNQHLLYKMYGLNKIQDGVTELFIGRSWAGQHNSLSHFRLDVIKLLYHCRTFSSLQPDLLKKWDTSYSWWMTIDTICQLTSIIFYCSY